MQYRGYGYVQDLIFRDGEVAATVVDRNAGYGTGGRYAYPYFGYNYGWYPGGRYYDLPDSCSRSRCLFPDEGEACEVFLGAVAALQRLVEIVLQILDLHLPGEIVFINAAEIAVLAFVFPAGQGIDGTDNIEGHAGCRETLKRPPVRFLHDIMKIGDGLQSVRCHRPGDPLAMSKIGPAKIVRLPPVCVGSDAFCDIELGSVAHFRVCSLCCRAARATRSP